MSISSNLKVKVILGNDIRRWRYTPSKSKLSSLNQFVSSSFNINEFWLQYEDDEGDRLTLSSNNDFEDAMDCAKEEDRKSLKIFVIQGSINSVHHKQQQQNQPNQPNQPSAPQQHAPCQSDSEYELNKCLEFKAAAIDFLTNPEIVKLLPDLHRRIFEQLKIAKLEAESNENKENDSNNANQTEIKWDSPASIEKIIRDLLSNEPKFKPIVSHELYTKKLDDMIPKIAIKMSTHLPILMNFSCEAIAAWIPHLANVLCQGFNSSMSPEYGHDMDTSSAMSSFFPLMCSFMSSHGDYSGLGGFCSADRDRNGDVIHYGVQCDQCGTRPIRGARFKCLRCKDYDLCGQCESFGKHEAKHPMIKFNHSVRNMAVPPFYGLHECLRHFGIPPPPHHAHGPHGPGHHQWGHQGAPHHGPGHQQHWRRHQQSFHRGRGNHHNRWNQYNHHQNQMDGQQQQSWWQPDGGYNRNRCGYNSKRWNNRWNQHQQDNQWDMQSQHGRSDNTGQVISSTITQQSQQTQVAQQQEKKIKVQADFVTDVTLPDRTYYPTDTVLTKTWRMRNNGEYEWGDDVELVFFKGNESLTLEKRYPVINAKPGQEVEISAVIKTPDNPGRYCSYYRLQRNGEYFGPRVWVDIFAVAEQDTVELNKNAMKKSNAKKNKGDKNKGDHKKQKLEKKEAKIEAKQLRLPQKQSKLEKKMERVSQKLNNAQNENENSKDLAKRQEKIQKQQNKIEKQMERLQEKQMNINNKLESAQFVDEQQLLDDIANAAVQDIANEIDIDAIPAISCMCGATLHKTSPTQAYNNGAQVNCDICGKFCPSNQSIYHCPNQRSQAHPEGYDLCCSCAEIQMQSFIPPRRPQQAQQPLIPHPVHHIQPPQQPLIDPIQPIIPPMQIVPNNVVPQQIEQIVQAQFVYQNELQQLKAMGFSDDERIKAELVQQQGNVQRVANRLLQLQ